MVEASFDRIREVLHSSGHAAVDGDRVADNMNADLYGINAESKYYWPHEVDLFHAAYDGTLRVVDETKGVWKNMRLARERGDWAGEGKRRRLAAIKIGFGDADGPTGGKLLS